MPQVRGKGVDTSTYANETLIWGPRSTNPQVCDSDDDSEMRNLLKTQSGSNGGCREVHAVIRCSTK
jgi:hypothetical protein